MTDNASFFKGIGDAQESRDSDYFRPGRYLVQVDKFIVKQNDEGLVFFIFEMTNLKCFDDSESLKDPDGPHGIGHKVSWILPRHKKPTMGNLKAAIMTMTGVPREAITDQFCGDLTATSQPLKGTFVEFQNKMIKTKNGAPFTEVKTKRRWTSNQVLELVGAETLDSLGIDLDPSDSE